VGVGSECNIGGVDRFLLHCSTYATSFDTKLLCRVFTFLLAYRVEGHIASCSTDHLCLGIRFLDLRCVLESIR